ncbi:recombinase RecT [Paenibacillus aurantiacus]|uniref:Recombinase RecT n=1 Tax=Paenibacillus aurantiacus TaxID=1936118 RepID=A0ABV5L0R0_9BACL
MAERVKKINEALNALIDSKYDALPADFNKTRFTENCSAYVRENSELQGLSEENVAAVLFKGAVLGLDFLARECHAIIDGTKVQFQTDYKGEMKLAKKYSVRPILDIYAKNVHEGDEFREEIVEGRPTVHFEPRPFNNSKIIGTFAVALFIDGGMIYETISADEIDSIRRNYSKNSTSGTWDKSPGEMNKRTVLRRLCKTIEIDFGAEQAIAFEAGSGFEFNREARPRQKSPLVIEPEIVTEEAAHEADQG